MFRRRGAGVYWILAVPILYLLLASAGFSQEPKPAPQPDSQTNQGQSKPSAGPSSDATQSESKPDQEKPEVSKPEAAKPETKITPQQAEQLFHEVDTILDFASKDTELAI